MNMRTRRLELKFKVKKLPSVKGLDLEEVVSPFKKEIERDFYYDTQGYDLLKHGNVLRNRDNRRIEFKLHLSPVEKVRTPIVGFVFHTFNKKNAEVAKIFKTLNLPFNDKYRDFNDFLRVNNLRILVAVSKKRRRFKVKEGMFLNLDEVIGLGCFVELEIHNANADVPVSVFKDEAFKILSEYGLVDSSAEFIPSGGGYVELYLKAQNPAVYMLSKYK